MVNIRECLSAYTHCQLGNNAAAESIMLSEDSVGERQLETIFMSEYEEFVFYRNLMNHNMWRRKRGGAIRQVSYYEE